MLLTQLKRFEARKGKREKERERERTVKRNELIKFV